MKRTIVLTALLLAASTAQAEMLLTTVSAKSSTKNFPFHMAIAWTAPPHSASGYAIPATEANVDVPQDIPLGSYLFTNQYLIDGQPSSIFWIESEIFNDIYLFDTGTHANDVQVTSEITTLNGIDLSGLDLHLSRMSFTLTSAVSPYTFTFQLFGEPGAVPEPSSALIVFVAAMFASIARPRCRWS